ncbi:MAG: hypothetical protein HQK97_05555 [Nitrospirae bacterium]|nr:hypothetical protein [Nitrospirota bacterium]
MNVEAKDSGRDQWERDSMTNAMYSLLMKSILTIENRLIWSEFAYLALNVCIIIVIMGLLSYADGRAGNHMLNISVLFLIVIGEFICVHWVISSMKHQMRLKLRYFQARYLERRQGVSGAAIFSDESHYFDPAIGYVESCDKIERVDYPSSGPTAMDGFLGGAKPRHLTWLMVAVIFFIYVALLLWVLNEMFRVF